MKDMESIIALTLGVQAAGWRVLGEYSGLRDRMVLRQDRRTQS
jgi:hypothetical protein